VTAGWPSRAGITSGRPGNRCNDAKCDPAGRLWVGTMSTARVPGTAALYVTSARHRLSPRQLAAEPLAGAVFALRPGTPGLPADRFAG
jgi:sugar lactone lactonase YvrE